MKTRGFSFDIANPQRTTSVKKWHTNLLIEQPHGIAKGSRGGGKGKRGGIVARKRVLRILAVLKTEHSSRFALNGSLKEFQGQPFLPKKLRLVINNANLT